MKHLKNYILSDQYITFLGCSEDKIDGSTDVYGSISGKVVSSDALLIREC
jgi:hypothetical protein